MDRNQVKLSCFAFAFLVTLKAAAAPFSFHIKEEPQSLDPITKVAGTNSILFSNLYRGLTYVLPDGRLTFDHAKKCKFKTDLLLRCELREKLKWSDGSPLKSDDYVSSFRHLLSKESVSPAADILINLKNARKILDGNAPVEQLGVRKVDDYVLEFDFDSNDYEFLEKLSHPLLAAYKDGVQSGPYKIKSWDKKKKIVLEPNFNFEGGNPKRPLIEVLFVGEDSTAVSLYEKGVLNFLWRLPTEFAQKFRDKPGFFQVFNHRLDYIGFNLRKGSPFENKDLRKKFSEAVDFESFLKVFLTKGRPGCPGLGDYLLEENKHCQTFKGVNPLVDSKSSFEIYYSSLGGDDAKIQMEWLQQQWKKNLGVNVKVRSMDHKQLQEKMKVDPPMMFRRAVILKRPTCLAGVEVFKKGHSENVTGFDHPRFETLAKALENRKMSPSMRRQVCGDIMDVLFKEEIVGIPTGLSYVSMMLDPKYEGVSINQMGTYDFSQLHLKEGAK